MIRRLASFRLPTLVVPRSRGWGRERFPITWNHVIEKESLNINKLEHVLMRHRIYPMSKYRKSRATFLRTYSRKTPEIKESAPHVSRRQWRPAGVLVFDRPSATEIARGRNERGDAPLVC